MKISDKNKEAIVSSVLVGLAYGAIGSGISYLNNASNWYVVGITLFIIGLCTGLATTWYDEE